MSARLFHEDRYGRDEEVALAFDAADDCELAEDDALGYDQVLEMPPPVFGDAERTLWWRLRYRLILGLPPASRAELLLRAVLSALRAARMLRSVSPRAFIVGTNLAIAKRARLREMTPLRDMARDLGIRYSTLLAVRRTALVQIGRLEREERERLRRGVANPEPILLVKATDADLGESMSTLFHEFLAELDAAANAPSDRLPEGDK